MTPSPDYKNCDIMKRKRTFQVDWINTFKWVDKCEDKYEAYCRICKVKLYIKNAGITNLKQHEISQKHINSLSFNEFKGPSLNKKENQILKNLTNISVSKVPNKSSKITDLNKKGMGSVLCQSKEQFVTSNLKISKEINISPINKAENSIILLKKLPNITLHVVNPKPVFKVPESPKVNPKKMNRTDNKSKPILESKVLIEKYNNITNLKNDNSKLFNNTTKNLTEKNSSFQKPPQCKRKPVQKTFDNITALPKNNYNTIILKIPEEIPKKYSYSEVKNTDFLQKTNTLNKLPKMSLSLPNDKSKNLITTTPTKKQKKSNSFSSHKINNTNYISTINNIENKTHESAKDYVLMDLSSASEINIVPASPPLDLINVNPPKYDSFAMGISKSSGENSMHWETFPNYIENQEFHFSNSRNYVDTSPNIKELINFLMSLES